MLNNNDQNLQNKNEDKSEPPVPPEVKPNPKLLNPNFYIQPGDPPQPPNFLTLSSPLHTHLSALTAKIAFYRNQVKTDIQFGYHDEKRATHNEGRHFKEFKENRLKLEEAV